MEIAATEVPVDVVAPVVEAPLPVVVAPKERPRVIVLIATIPARQRSCARILDELTKQRQRPDGVVLVLDGYGPDAPAPACALPVLRVVRTDTPSGAGLRWRYAAELPPDDIVICLDDDVMLCEAPKLVQALALAVETGGGAAAAMGYSAAGRMAPPGIRSFGDVVYGAGCGLTVRAGHLVGLQSFADDLVSQGGPNALGLHGHDDALVSAFLWKSGVIIRHAATGNIFAAPGTRASSQTVARAARRESPDAQRLAIKKLTGWTWIPAGSKK